MPTPYTERTLESICGYPKRESERQRHEKIGEKLRALLIEADFRDRITTYMLDLWELPDGEPLTNLPSYGFYLKRDDLPLLGKYTRVNDPTATANDILVSLEQYFPPIRVKVNGEWKFTNEKYIHYLREEKPVIPGTLTSPYADILKEIRLEREERERQEEEKEKKVQEKNKVLAQKRKEARERRKAQKNNVDSTSEGSTS